MNDGGATFSAPTSPAATPLSTAGSVTPDHRPVSRRLIRASSAATISAGVKVQWPARCTNTSRKRAVAGRVYHRPISLLIGVHNQAVGGVWLLLISPPDLPAKSAGRGMG